MACAFLSLTGGKINVFSTLISLSSAGQIVVQNDEPGAHTLSIDAITQRVDPVQGIDLAGPMVLVPSINSGPNAGLPFLGSNSTQRTVVLVNAGTDRVFLGVSGSLDEPALAGTYRVTATVTCI
jgi:hypothetical protein